VSLRQKDRKGRFEESLGKLPPQAPELEESVLGAILLEKNAIVQVVDIVKPDDFYLEAHKVVYEAVLSLYKQDKPIDLRTVKVELERMGALDTVGGAYFLAEITSKVSSAANIEYHARIIAEMSIRRSIITDYGSIIHDSYDHTIDVFELLDRAQKALDDIAGNHLKGSFKSSDKIYMDAIESMQKRRNQTGIVGAPCGYLSIDRITGGWQNQTLIIIAARPSMGKSAFVGNVARNAAVDFKIPVAIFSLEMSSLQFMNRMISAESEVELDKIFKANFSDYEMAQIGQLSGRLHGAPIFIDDTAALTILEVRAKARRLKADKGIKLIIIDYLQLMKGDSNAGNREQEIASISRGLKQLSKELDIPVIALSQLGRGVETRGGDKRPMLSDLRESGAIEQDADIVMFLYRPEYYNITSYEDGMPTAGAMEAIIAKHRNGSLDSPKLKFIGKYSKVREYDDFKNFSPAPKAEAPVNSYKDFQVSRNEHQFGKDEDEAPF
jgi:replicative DNA helicase